MFYKSLTSLFQQHHLRNYLVTLTMGCVMDGVSPSLPQTYLTGHCAAEVLHLQTQGLHLITLLEKVRTFSVMLSLNYILNSSLSVISLPLSLSLTEIIIHWLKFHGFFFSLFFIYSYMSVALIKFGRRYL